MRFELQLRAAILADELIRPGDHVLVAVSGGSDSVALLRALHRLAPSLRCRLTVAHLDHRMRGADARADARFVRRLARDLRVPCIAGRADVPALARRQRISLEMAARAARHAFFRRAARRCGATCVATAHTADDQAETVLLRLARGSGLQGLAGMAPRRAIEGLAFIRPMLSARREAARAWLRRLDQPWREDATNAEPICRRNRVRRNVLPAMAQALNPALVETLARTADRLREDAEWMDAAARAAVSAARPPNSTALTVAALLPHPAALRRRALTLWMRERGVPEERLDDARLRAADRALTARGGRRQIELGEGSILVRRGGVLRVERARAAAGTPRALSAALTVPGVTEIAAAGLRISVEPATGFRKPRRTAVGALPAWTYLRAAAVGRRRLRVRSWRPGDRIAPLGMAGSRKLQDIFVDAKVPEAQRAAIPVLLCGRTVVWIPGYRIARGFDVRSPTDPSLRICIAVAHAATWPQA